MLTFVSNSESKLAEYRELLGLPKLLRQPLPKAESATNRLDVLVREKCEQTVADVDPPFFVEHTSFEIAALGDWPGVLTQPFLSKNSNAKILKMMEEYEDEKRTATARVAIGFLAAREAKVRLIEGETRGRISRESRGVGGFGWDAIFIPDGDTKTYAEMDIEQKNRTSMRAKAAASFKIILEELRVDGLIEASARSAPGKHTNVAPRPVNVFVSYSHQDRNYLRKGGLLDYLSGLTRENFNFWHDERLIAGDIWDDVIQKQLTAADIVLVLVSQSFLNSKYCMDIEVARSLQNRVNLGAVIFPVILSKCDWERHSWLASTQFEPREGRTVARNYKDRGARQELYYSIQEQLRTIAQRMTTK